MSRIICHCPTCGFEGQNKLKGAPDWALPTFLICLFVGLCVWPLLLVAFVVFCIMIFTPQQMVCGRCGLPGAYPVQPAAQAAGVAVAAASRPASSQKPKSWFDRNPVLGGIVLAVGFAGVLAGLFGVFVLMF